jgi:uncharacterized protein (DUF1697 family)
MKARVWAALLRAVNVGGTGKLPMRELVTLCQELGFTNVRTYIASGNVVFAAAGTEADVKVAIEGKLQTYAGKPVGVVVRSDKELADLVAGNPFPDANPSQTVAIVTDDPLPENAMEGVTGRADEDLALGRRALYVNYNGRMGRSKLKVPAAKNGTARNMNTLRKLAEMAAAAST